jgi:hypothetical protein
MMRPRKPIEPDANALKPPLPLPMSEVWSCRADHMSNNSALIEK